MGRVAQSVQRLATGWKVRGSNPSGGRDFPHLSRSALGSTQPPVQCVLGLSGGKEWPGRAPDPSPPSSAVVMKGQSYTSTRPIGRTACTEPQCLYKGALYLYLYLLSYMRSVVGRNVIMGRMTVHTQGPMTKFQDP